MSIYKRILLATDLTDENEVVIKRGAEFAKLCNASLVFVHVVEPLPGYGYAFVGVADIETQLLEEAKQAISNLAAKYEVLEADCHVEVGATKMEIVDLIERENIDCVVLGSHGRHGAAELLGSTAHALVHGAPCDVVTVRITG